MRCIALLLTLVSCVSRGFAQTPRDLALDLATDREFYMENASHKVYAEATIAGGTRPAAEAAPLRNVVFVLDRSGSMAGERLQGLRDGLAAALALLGERDFVSVILFGSEVETLLESQPRGSLANPEGLLAQVEPVGGSALYDALNQGVAQLRRHTGPATSNHLILVTDGPPTKGPRDLADFVRLARVFAEERITMSTIGLGDEFNEDMLAALARAGNGQFRYIVQPAKLAEVLPEMLATSGSLVASDVSLTVEILSDFRDLETYGWVASTVDQHTVTYHLPYVFAGQKISLFFGAEMEARRFSYRFARFKLAWTGVDGARRDLEKTVTVRLESDTGAISSSANPPVIRTAVRVLISDSLQKAIEQIDKGDFKRALRVLRSARTDAYALNFKLDDPAVAESIRRFEGYLNEVQARGLNQLDRKVLRSGLFNQFGVPVAKDSPDTVEP